MRLKETDIEYATVRNDYGELETLPDSKPTRKQRFDAALRLAGLSIEQWRTRYYRVSWQHLNEVFKGERTASAELNAAIDEVIQKYLGDAAA